MSPSAGNTDVAVPKRSGLLPWQAGLVCAVMGLFAVQFPLPAVVAVLLFLLGLFLTGSLSTILAPGLCFAAGWLAASVILPAPVPIDKSEIPEWMAEQKEVRIRARVKEVRPKPEDRLQIILERPHFRAEGEQGKLSRDLVWNWYQPARMPSPGDVVKAKLRIEPVRGNLNSGTWDTRFYWARQGVGYKASSEGSEAVLAWSRDTAPLWRARQAVSDAIIRHTPDGAGQGILLALLCGDKSELSYGELNLIRRASLSHILAQSGLHLGFLAGLGWILAWSAGGLRPSLYMALPRQRLAVLCALPLIGFYLWLGQFKPSLMRASLMFLFWGVLLWRGRGRVLADGLCAAVAVMILLWPLGVFDLGLQLSVAAVAGIVFFWPGAANWLQERLPESLTRPAAFYPLSILGISLVVNAALLPLLLWYFGQVSPHIYLNLVWIPAVGFLVMPAGLAGLAGAWIPGLEAAAGFLLQTAGFLLDRLFALLQILDGMGWLQAFAGPRPRWPEMLGYWSLLIWLLMLSKYGLKRLWPLGLCAALLLSAPVMRGFLAGSSRVDLTVFDVGQGQSLMVSTPEKRVLIDGGGSWNKEFDVGRLILSPALSWGRLPVLDSVVLTHPDFDHMRGLYYILRRYQVDRFLYNGRWPQGWDGRRLKNILANRDIPARALEHGQAMDLGSGAKLEVLHSGTRSDTEEANESSLVLRLAKGETGLALLPADAGKQALDRVISSGRELEAQVLMVPHHGSRNSHHPRLYEKSDPELALVSCGYLNHFHFPHQEVRSELKELGVPLLSTAKNGNIRVRWDLTSLRREVSVQHGSPGKER